MKSNLDYFTILKPRRERVWSKTYLFEMSNFVFELQNSENASVEFQYVKDPIISDLSSPYTMLYLIYRVHIQCFYVIIA